MLKKDDRSQQMVYYQVGMSLVSTFLHNAKHSSQAGIGTYTVPQIATPRYAKFSKMVDMAIAQNLDAHVMGRNTYFLLCPQV